LSYWVFDWHSKRAPLWFNWFEILLALKENNNSSSGSSNNNNKSNNNENERQPVRNKNDNDIYDSMMTITTTEMTPPYRPRPPSSKHPKNNSN
jgi:hypothetical protein